MKPSNGFLIAAFTLALVAVGCWPLAACNGVQQPAINSTASAAASVADAVGVPKPAVLANTSIDEKAITLAAKAVNVAALSSTALVKAGVITPGSSRAVALADALDRARKAVNAASAARDAADAASYTAAVDDAQKAVADIEAVLQ